MARKEKRSERSKIDATPPGEKRKPAPTAATTGPFDITDEPDDEVARVDFGAIRVPASDLEMRLDVSETCCRAMRLTGMISNGNLPIAWRPNFLALCMRRIYP